MVLVFLMAGLFSASLDVKAPPKSSACVLKVGANGQIRLIGPNFEGSADQILALGDGQWELVGTEQRPAKLSVWTVKPNPEEWVSGIRIIYSPDDRIKVYASGVKRIMNRAK